MPPTNAIQNAILDPGGFDLLSSGIYQIGDILRVRFENLFTKWVEYFTVVGIASDKITFDRNITFPYDYTSSGVDAYACNIPGSLLKMEGNNQTSGTLMSLEGEDLSTGTVLQIDKRSYNRSMASSRYKLLHARTSSINFTNAVLISQDLLQHANSTIVSLRSKKIIEGSLLKMSLDDSASESSKIISVIASQNTTKDLW